MWPIQIQIKTSASCIMFHREREREREKTLHGLYQYGTTLQQKECPDLDSHPLPQFSIHSRFQYL